MSIYFEKITAYKDIDLPMPERKTSGSAGYDFVVAEDIVIPSYPKMLEYEGFQSNNLMTLTEMADFTKATKFRPTLVPTGMKCHMRKNQHLEISVRSSCPLKHWLIMANGVGIIDSDYCDNPDNEGHIFFQIINLSPCDIQLKRGDIIGQGIIYEYCTTDDDTATGERTGGFGSTNKDVNN